MDNLKHFIDNPSELRAALKDSDLTTLQQAHQLLLNQIEEKRHHQADQQLQRKGQRVLADLRGLMAKAGVSMDELQAVLPK